MWRQLAGRAEDHATTIRALVPGYAELVGLNAFDDSADERLTGSAHDWRVTPRQRVERTVAQPDFALGGPVWLEAKTLQHRLDALSESGARRT